MCPVEGSVRKCPGVEMSAAVSVEACPGSHLWTGSDLLVTEVRGWAAVVQLTRTTLTCSDFKHNTRAILNGEKCEHDAWTSDATSTTTTKRTPWWPDPFPVPEEEHNPVYNTTTISSTDATTASTTSTATSTITTRAVAATVMVAVTAGFQWNSLTLILTIAVAVTAFGVIVSVRCVRRRRRRHIQPPVKIDQVSSTTCTPEPHISLRRRRQREGSLESIELFVRNKRD